GPDRILVDAAGHMVGIALKPYELLRVTSRVEDFSIGEGGERRPRVERTRRTAARTPELASGPSPKPGAPPVESAAGPAAPLTGGRGGGPRVAGAGAPSRLMAQLPGIYHGWPELSQLLSTFETIPCEPHPGALETQITQIATLLDVIRTPRELPGWVSAQAPGHLSRRRGAFVPWLREWGAPSGTASLPIERQRSLIERTVT